MPPFRSASIVAMTIPATLSWPASGAPSLRRTILLALTLGLLLLIGAQYLLANKFFERQLLDIESNDAFTRLRNLQHGLEVLGEDLQSTTADWAQWDAAYGYVTQRDDKFAENNLDAATIARLRLNFVVVVDQNGRVLFAHSVSDDGASLLDPPAEIVRMAQGRGVLGLGAAPATKLTGLVASTAGPFLVSSQSVLMSVDDVPPRGRLIMGRSLNGFVAPALRRMSGESLIAEAFDATGRPHAQGEIYRSNGRETLRLHDHKLNAYTPLEDLWGRPIAELRIDMPRPMQGMLESARYYLLAGSVLVGLSFCCAGLILIRSRVIVPLEQIARTVSVIGDAGRPAALVPSQASAEFETLGEAINGMLRQLEQQQTIQRDRDAAIEANRLKSEFLATRSQEFRTPMNGVLGMCELLQRTELNSRQRHLSDTILRSARSLLEILNDILDFSKIESGRLELERAPFSPIEIVQTVSAPFVAAAQVKGLDFIVRIESGVPPLLVGDALRLRQVITNLLSNAIKFTERGSVSVGCRLNSTGPNGIELQFDVADTGIGVARAAQERIFDPFAQAETNTSRRYGGTGLGLAIVRRLVTAMGGSIELHSEPGRGSNFTFTVLLQAAPESLQPRPMLVDATGPRFSVADAPSILLAEDNAVNREVISEMLEHIGCRVTAVENGALALASVAERSFDAILMDCQMPVMDGHTATSELRELERATSRPPTFIIALTADATAENRRRCLDAGMDEVVTKPISQAGLRDVILQAVRPAKAAMA
jgi:signal transduction histidine kinase